MTEKEILKQIVVARKFYKAAEIKLTRLCNIKRLMDNNKDERYAAMLPDDISEFSQKQIDWVLHHYHGSSEFRYKFSHELFKKYCWSSAMGFHDETKQFVFMLSKYTFMGDEYNEKKFFKFFDSAIMRMKPIHADDCGVKEFGIALHLMGLVEDVTSVLYILKDGSINLHMDRYERVRKFDNFKQFIEWFKQEVKHDT